MTATTHTRHMEAFPILSYSFVGVCQYQATCLILSSFLLIRALFPPPPLPGAAHSSSPSPTEHLIVTQLAEIPKIEIDTQLLMLTGISPCTYYGHSRSHNGRENEKFACIIHLMAVAAHKRRIESKIHNTHTQHIRHIYSKYKIDFRM